MDIHLQISMLLWTSIWISLDFCGYPCTGFLWILNPRGERRKEVSMASQENVNFANFYSAKNWRRNACGSEKH